MRRAGTRPVQEELASPHVEIAGNGVEDAAGAAALVGAETDDIHGKAGEEVARLCCGIHPGGFADFFGRNPRNAFHSLRRIGGHTLREPIPDGDAFDFAAVRQRYGEGTAQTGLNAFFLIAHGVGIIGDGAPAGGIPDEKCFRIAALNHVAFPQQLARIAAHEVGAVAPVFHKFAVKELFGNDDVDPAQHERAAGAGAILQPEVGYLDRFRFIGIDGDDLAAPGLALLDVAEEFRLRPGGIAAPDDGTAGIGAIAGGIVPVGEHFYLTAVAVAGLASHGEDVRGAEQAGKAVAGKGKPGADHAVQTDAHGLWPAFSYDSAQLFRNFAEGLFPAYGLPLSFPPFPDALERRGQTPGILREFEGNGPAPRAHEPP